MARKTAEWWREYRARKAAKAAGAVQDSTILVAQSAAPSENPSSGPKPGFLAAPDDDCLACNHDRHAYHLDGACTFPTGRRSRCGCPSFVPAF